MPNLEHTNDPSDTNQPVETAWAAVTYTPRNPAQTWSLANADRWVVDGEVTSQSDPVYQRATLHLEGAHFDGTRTKGMNDAIQDPDHGSGAASITRQKDMFKSPISIVLAVALLVPAGVRLVANTFYAATVSFSDRVDDKISSDHQSTGKHSYVNGGTDKLECGFWQQSGDFVLRRMNGSAPRYRGISRYR